MGDEPRTSGVAPRMSARADAPEPAEAQLRRYIVEGGLNPGDRLPSEAELVAVVGSSRVVVREALRSLEALGVLESRAGSGWFVRGFDAEVAARTFARSLAFHPHALLDLLAVRRATEADLYEGMAGHLADGDLAALDELVDRMRWRAARGTHAPAEDAAFHRHLAAASGNAVALALVDVYWGVMEVLYRRGLPPPAPEMLAGVAEAHAAIVDALRRGDGAAAAHALRLSHDEGQRRFAAWRDTLSARPDGTGRDPLDAAVLAAMLWPGMRSSR